MRTALKLIVALASVTITGSVRLAAAEPMMGRVLTAPTAWLPPSGAVIGTTGSDHHGAGMIDVGIGLGGIASIHVGADTDVRGCTLCDGTDAKAIWMGRAAFRMGARQDAWFKGQPALVIGLRTTFAARGHELGGARAVEAYGVASRELGAGVRLHGGAAVIDGGYRQEQLGVTLRPLVGLEWTPTIYPRTSVLADIMWEPRMEPDGIALEWIAGWGVRYQALRWGSIELAVRHREDEGLGQSTVLVRLNGVWLTPAQRRAVTQKAQLAR